ncbi:MAG: bacterioferritin-associated ferredoxin [Halarcobacter sp.]
MIKDFDDNYEVCNCKKITLGQIRDLVEEHSIKSLGMLQEITKAGTECRNCIFKEADQGKIKKQLYCKDILKEING